MPICEFKDQRQVDDKVKYDFNSHQQKNKHKTDFANIARRNKYSLVASDQEWIPTLVESQTRATSPLTFQAICDADLAANPLAENRLELRRTVRSILLRAWDHTTYQKPSVQHQPATKRNHGPASHDPRHAVKLNALYTVHWTVIGEITSSDV